MQYLDDDTHDYIIREAEKLYAELETLASDAHPLLADFLEQECETFWNFIEARLKKAVLEKMRH